MNMVGHLAQFALPRDNIAFQIADEQVTTANDYYYMNNWDWSPWAYGYPYGWPYVDSIYNY